MEELIGNIVGNIIPIIVIIGIILNFIKRFKGTNNEQQSQGNAGRPDQNNEPSEQRKTTLKDIFQQFEDVFTEEPPKPRRVEPKKEEPTREISSSYQEVKNENTYSTERTVPVSPTMPRSNTKSSTLRNISKKRAVEGMIWSEVLGPPRAKKPYNSTRR